MTEDPRTPDEPAGNGAPRPPRDWGAQPGSAPSWGDPPPPAPRLPGTGSDAATGAEQAVQPGIVPVRPLTLGELYDGAFRAIRANPRVLFTFAAIVVAAVGLLQAVASWRAHAALATVEEWAASGPELSDPGGELEVVAAQLVTGALAQVLAWIATTVLTGLLVRTVYAAVLGEAPSVRQAWAGVRGSVWRLLGLALTVIVAVAALALAPPVLLGLLGTGLGGAWPVGGIAIGIVVALVALAFVVPRTVLATPALVVERRGIGGALVRAWQLARGSSARVLGILVLTWILVGVANGIITYPMTLLGGAVDPTGLGWAYALGTLGAVLASAVTTPVAAAVTSLLYLDLRIRREGAASVLTAD
ncbi:integral membrane protein [Beutenbergia cavernae DSM 12333]|uniref:Integral membrane protein n=1 Tax=Beutenbergia cavernae (strain ATCC BAA-8 / DSM 12333 / CCUG 43141 / JCM 11478 / NBRC 16432 / NCIMB 13614 / HKI 0122) TaxID=471853 RepID=C5C1N1_BEUC1|nr:hypothetical protein [Beutenbergia cavernae]ACQ79499.1 integral membrane protein [Beutenbergia cavernae DSM 12333]